MYRTRPFLIALAGSLLLVLGCGGGGGGSTPTPTPAIQPPTALSYSTNPAVYTKGSAITANSPSSASGVVVSYGVSPALPAGLAISTSTGVVSGTPTALASSANYTVTATNTGGSTGATLSITVNDAAPANLTYTTTTASYIKGTVIPANSPSNTGGAVVSYGVSPALPLGLTLNTSTGVISGTPTTVTASAAYTVTATNTGGSTPANLNITVLLEPTLPANLQIVSGNTQTGFAGEELPVAVVVRVTDSAGAPVVGQLINYRVTLGGGSVFAGSSLSDSNGTSRERWTLGPLTGTSPTPQKLEARAVDSQTGAAIVFATFDATAVARPPASLSYTTSSPTYTRTSPITTNNPTSPGGAVVSYSVNPALPVGLTLNTSTGIITGAPTVTSTATSYTVTASNSGGSTPANLTITVIPEPVIASFTAAPSTIDVGNASILSYSFTGGTGAIDQGVGAVVSGGTKNVNPTSTTTYTLTVTNTADTPFPVTAPATITVIAAPPGISKTAGDNQSAPPGTAVAIAPVVTVRNTLGVPIAGANVTFAVTGGGGTIQSTTAQTDGTGKASCGSWRLGAAKGLNTVSASVIGLTSAIFTAKAVNTSADVSISVMAPTAGLTVNESMIVAATVTSTYSLSTVTASVNGTSVLLTYGPYGRYGGNAWNGTLSLVGQPRGTIGVVFSATDALAHTTDVIVSAVYDRYPTVTVATPLEGSVARPKIDLSATCSDDDPAGPVSLTASVNGTVVATGVNAISQQVDLSAYEGQSITLAFTGVDSIGQRTTVNRTVNVESSTRLSVWTEVNGQVWDVSGTRTLFLDSTGTVPALKILDSATGVTQTVETTTNLVGTWGCYGYLTASGAIYVRGANPLVYPYSWLFEWRGGTLTNLAGLNSAQSLRVAGNWAIYSASDPVTNLYNLYWRNLGTGVSTLLTANAGNIDNDVASNGDIAYWTSAGTLPYNIFRWRSGSSQRLTSDTYPATQNGSPVTDGINVVYFKNSSIALHNGSSETILSATSGGRFAVAGGYVAYPVADISKVAQVWRHSTGGEQQVTFYGTASTIDGIGPDGTILLTHSPKRYQSIPGGALQEVGSTLGRVIYRDGKFLVLLGRVVLEVLP
ncbi:MAG: putative Ig domain-containing protein [Betaproteobacteria bacterium]